MKFLTSLIVATSLLFTAACELPEDFGQPSESSAQAIVDGSNEWDLTNSNLDSIAGYVDVTSFPGYQGDYQNAMRQAWKQLPEPLKDASSDVVFVNGCHPWTQWVYGWCSPGMWDEKGRTGPGVINNESRQWTRSIWISNQVFENEYIVYGELLDVTYVMTHEASHVFSDTVLSPCGKQHEAQQRFLLPSTDAVDEGLADALTQYFLGDVPVRYKTSYLTADDIEYLTQLLEQCDA